MSFAAILSATRAISDSSAQLRASLHFAGQTLVEYQVRQAVRAGAERVIIIVSVITPELSRAVDRLAADGIIVALVRDTTAMMRDVPVNSDILMVADGAVIAQDHYDAMAAVSGDAVLVTDDSNASASFERIDAGQRWAAMVRVSPNLLHDTLDMIGEWDLTLTLLRGVVQSGARRLTVPQDDLLEGRVALVADQAQADSAAQAILASSDQLVRRTSGIEYFLLARIARWVGPALMRMQVPAMQVRIAAIILAAIGLIAVELAWVALGLFLFLISLLIAEVADRLDELALRRPPSGWLAFLAPVFTLAGIALAAESLTGLHLTILLLILLFADRRGNLANLRPWMVMTPATALFILFGLTMAGRFAFGVELTILGALASIAALALIKKR